MDIISLIQSKDFNQKIGPKIPLTIHMNIHIKQAVQRLHRVKFVWVISLKTCQGLKRHFVTCEAHNCQVKF